MIKRTAIALGFFDGVHIAHQKIIQAAVTYAENHTLEPVALTFDRSPAEVLFGKPQLYLTDNSEKRAIIEGMSADCVTLKASPELLKMSGADFVKKMLAEKMNALAVFCGYNYTFGSDRLNANDLKRICSDCGIDVCTLPEERLGGEAVSSSRIRALLCKGDTEAAAKLLGRHYSVTGVVEHGKRLGRTMGFPTVNIYPEPSRSLLPRGVYATLVSFDGERHVGVTNVGVNPTVGGEKMRIESFIPNYSGNLYYKTVKTEFVHFVRPERKFASVDELFSQISADTEAVVKLMQKFAK